MNRLLAAIVFSVLVIAAPSSAQQPSAVTAVRQRGAQAETGTEQVTHGHHYIVAIGIDHYQSWPVLGTAVSDATGFAKLLTTSFGFEYAAEPLTENNATRDNINSLIDDDLRAKLKPEDDLIIFFAGHGTTRNDKIGDQTSSVGFIVPFEARASSANEHWSDYIDIDEFLQKISSLPSSHILVILDSCHSGMALGSRFNRTRADIRFQQDMLRKVSRKIITSAQNDQLAADSGPLPDHSLFTGLLINGLTTGQADTFKQGFITATQLGAYTQHAVGVAAGSRQTPLFGAFDLDAGGELIIPLGAGAAAPTPTSVHAAPTLTQFELNEIARIRVNPRLYWQDNDPLKNFPAARSATLSLCSSGDGWACAQAADSFRLGLGGGADYMRAVELARQGCEANATDSCVILAILQQSGQTIAPDPQGAARLYRDSCTKGNLRGCNGLGLLYQDGKGVAQDPAQAQGLLGKACDGGEMLGCRNLGSFYQAGPATTQDAALASTYFLKACNGSDVPSCNTLGYSYQTGRGVQKDPVQAVTFYRKACDGGYMLGCNNLGYSYSTGYGLEKDLVQAVSLLHKACDGGEMRGCDNLAYVYSSGGPGVAKDVVQAATLYRKGCDGGEASSCTNLGLDYASGNGVDKDLAQAVSLYRKACDAGETSSCTDLGLAYENGQAVDKDPAQAAVLYRKACDGGETYGCNNLGVLYALGKGVAKDDIKAATFYAKACDGGDMKGCTNSGIRYENGLGVTKDFTKAIALFRKSCDGGESDGCVSLGIRYENGEGVAKDAGQADNLYRKACDAGSMIGCRFLGMNYQTGLGIPKDPAQATSFFQKACDGGDQNACDLLKTVKN